MAKASIISKLYSLSHMSAYQLTKVTCKGLAELGSGGVEIEPFAIIKWNNKVIFESDPVRIAGSKENGGSGQETPVQPRSKTVYSFRYTICLVLSFAIIIYVLLPHFEIIALIMMQLE